MNLPSLPAFPGPLLLLLLLLLSLTNFTTASFLIGLGNLPYDPLCAESCLRSLTSYTLDCTHPPDDDGGHSSHMGPATSPECFASNSPFLTTVAWCLSTKCAEEQGVAVSKLEEFWEREVTGDRSVRAKWPYSIALERVDPRPPRYQLKAGITELNETSVVEPGMYLSQWNVLGMVVRENVVESKYSVAIFVTAVGLPIVLTWLGYVPFVGSLLDKLKPYLIYPALIAKYQVQPLPFHLGNAPTVGQALYLAVFLALSIILAAVGYESGQPNAWFPTQSNEISAYVLYRTGTLSFMLLPLVFLFASRNNILLWLANWSHATYLLLHRWVARVFMLYVVIHSIIGLQIYPGYAQEVWWIWGAVATVATAILAVGSGLYVRMVQYELFLISHVVLSVFVVVGCWYHLWGWYVHMGMPATVTGDTWAYENWLYFAMAVWGFDRLVRVGRVLRNGARRAQVTDLGGGYMRVDVPGIRWSSRPGQHVYVYFPTVDLRRPWENHPFSVIPTASLGRLSSISVSFNSKDEENQQGTSTPPDKQKSSDNRPSIGITLFIRQHTGLTKQLRANTSLLTFLDGPYSNSHASPILRCGRILLIAGGIGITGVLPWAYQHRNVKLAWSVSESARCLTEAIELGGVAEREVRVGQRFDVKGLVEAEAAAGWKNVGVVVSGPGSLCDVVRDAVARAGRSGGTVFELEVDAYSW